jgi:CarD family transcriptional regulator
VEEIAPISHMKCSDPDRLYYKLYAIHRGDTVYVPVDAPVFMRPLISQREAETLLENAGEIPEETLVTGDAKALQARYRQMLDTHSCERLVGLIRSVDAKERQLSKAGRHLSRTDQEYRKRADTLVCEELAAALEQPVEEVRTRLRRSVHARSSA